MPIAVWDLLPEHPAYSFVGFVTSENLALGQTPSSTDKPVPRPTSKPDQPSAIFAKEMSHATESDSSIGSPDLDGANTPLSVELTASRPSSRQPSPSPIYSGRNPHQEEDGEAVQPLDWLTGFGILDRNQNRVSNIIERLGRGWNDAEAVTLRTKIFFICGVLNILISGYLIGGYPHLFHYWYTAHLLYLMPIRYYTYYNRGWGYFLVDLCYFVNFLCICTIWIFPHSTNLFIGTYCLAFRNNAFGIAIWRNITVFHNLEKTTTLFIHIMPCVA
jgi:hypothetical protein